MSFSRKTILLVFLIALLWAYLGGLNGYWYQASDWDCRNAVYFDLIQYGWPVHYNMNGGALVYYIGHWLPTAVIAKAIMYISGSTEVGLFAGRMLLWIWSSIGLAIVLLLLFQVLHADRKSKRILIILIFILFSGMDFLGGALNGNLSSLLNPLIKSPSGPHLEWWTGLQFSSNTTLLYWVFNQTIVSWIITLLFLQDETPGNYAFYCVTVLICGPFSCVGLFVLMIVKASMNIVSGIKSHQKILPMFLTPQNFLSIAILFPPIAAYLLSANAVVDAGTMNEDVLSMNTLLSPYLITFIFIEVGFYLLFIFIDNYKNPLYYSLWGTFVIFPAIHIGKAGDFCMRATIPALLVLMVYLCRYLIDYYTHFRKSTLQDNVAVMRKVCARFIIICLIIGAVTPIVEIYRGFYHVMNEKTITLENQSMMTFDSEQVNYNFVAANPEEHFFFKHFSR